MRAPLRSLLLGLAAALALPAYADDLPARIYQLDFEQAKELAHQVMVEAQGGNKVNEWIERSRTTFSVSGGGVVRGGWSWGVSVRPVDALSADGKRVSGVLFEPHASHGPGTGKGEFTEGEADKLLAKVLERAEQTGKGIAVARVLGEPGATVAAPPAAPEATSSAAEELSARLRALKSLHDSGAITDAEYDAKRKELLARF